MPQNEQPQRSSRFGPKPVPTLERVQTSYVIAENGCWIWTGQISKWDGYGRIVVGSKADRSQRSRVAHRVAYELLVGPIPDGFDLDHRCHNEDQTCVGGKACRHRACINPEHLVPATRRENLLAGRGFAAERASQTHCMHGHAFTPDNTYRAPNGTRKCRLCAKRRAAESERRRPPRTHGR